MKKINLTKLSILTIFFNLPWVVLSQSSNVTTFKGKQYMLVGNEWQHFDPVYQEMRQVISDEVIIKFKPTTTSAEITNFEAANDLVLYGSCLGFRNYRYSVVPSNVFQKATSMQSSPLVEDVHIGTNGKFLFSPNDPAYSQMWYADAPNNVDLNLPAAWDLMQGNTDGVIVAVIDGGLDASHFDLGMGNDSYQNVFVNSVEIPGNGVDDDNNGYVDDVNGWSFTPGIDPVTLLPTNGSNDPLNHENLGAAQFNRHGTSVATIIAGKTNNNYGIAGIAGDPNSGGAKVMLLSVQKLFPQPNGTLKGFPNTNVVHLAIYYAVNMGAKVINMSFGMGNSPAMEAALQYANDNGVVMICAGGQYGTVIEYPAIHPLTIAVGGFQNQGSKLGIGNFGYHLDVTAPGESVVYSPESGVVTSSDGTSFAAPIASGVAALMLAYNPCMSHQMVKETLHATAVKSGGYNYNWEEDKPGHSKEMGYGRIDAEAAVQAAIDLKNPLYDLSIRDRVDDIGSNSGYTWTWNFDQSPDIWLRNNNDGFINQFQEHFFEYSSTDIRYVYVRVTNRGCAPSLGGELVKVYFAAAGVNASWPWGSSGFCNNVLPSVALPILQPGESTIVELVFDPANYTIDCNANHCFMARIENSGGDVIVDHPNDLGQDIYVNNNIAMRNVVFYDIVPGINPPVYEDVQYPHGSFVSERGNRIPFDADAGNTHEIDLGETLTLIAENIGEYATYNWYDQNGDLVYSGQTFSVTPDFTRTYTLEVIANADGFKDYAEVEVNVRRNKINFISPNPGSTIVNLDYEVSEVNSAYIMIIGVNTNAPVSNYILDVNQNNLTLDVSNYLNGVYSVILICDGEIVDFSNFEKN